MADTVRVIVCGSREWADVERLEGELTQALFLLGWSHGPLGKPLVLVHGACPTGADAIARHWGESQPRTVTLVAYPADWARHGKKAGPMRNEQMARHGADLCVAFWDGMSSGTFDMIRRATEHGIPVRIVPAKRRESPSGDGGGKDDEPGATKGPR